MATRSSILAWEVPWTEGPGGATVHEIARSWMQLRDWACTRACAHTHTHTLTHSLFSLSLKPNSLHFFPRPGGTGESLNGLSNFACFCLLASGTSPVQVRESPVQVREFQTLDTLPFLFSVSQEHRGPSASDNPCVQVPVCSRPSCKGWEGAREDAGISKKGGGLGGGRRGRLRGSGGCRGSWEPCVPPWKRNLSLVS